MQGFTSAGNKSEPISLSEVHTAYGTQYDDVSLILYKVQNGNTEACEINGYRKDGSLIKSEEGSYDILQIVPETFGEEVFLAVRDYARTHHAQLIRNAYSN